MVTEAIRRSLLEIQPAACGCISRISSSASHHPAALCGIPSVTSPAHRISLYEKEYNTRDKNCQARNKPLYHYFSNHLRLIFFRQLLENRQRTLNHSRIYAISSTEIPGTPEIRPRNQKQIILFCAFAKRIIIFLQCFRE